MYGTNECDWYSISGPGCRCMELMCVIGIVSLAPGCRCMGLMSVIGIVSMALGVGVWN